MYLFQWTNINKYCLYIYIYCLKLCHYARAPSRPFAPLRPLEFRKAKSNGPSMGRWTMASMVYQFEGRPLKSIENRRTPELGKAMEFWKVPASVPNRFFLGFLGLSDLVTYLFHCHKDHHFGWNMVGDSQNISSKIDYDELTDRWMVMYFPFDDYIDGLRYRCSMSMIHERD